MATFRGRAPDDEEQKRPDAGRPTEIMVSGGTKLRGPLPLGVHHLTEHTVIVHRVIMKTFPEIPPGSFYISLRIVSAMISALQLPDGYCVLEDHVRRPIVSVSASRQC